MKPRCLVWEQGAWQDTKGSAGIVGGYSSQLYLFESLIYRNEAPLFPTSSRGRGH